MISDAIRRLRRDFGIPVDPARRGPVPLHRFFREMVRPRVDHRVAPKLTRARVLEVLRADGVPVDDVGEPTEELAGFLFFAGNAAWAFVNADDILPRRRFTAAHELGHAVLHRDRMGRFAADTDATLLEADDAKDPIEREANRFAAELLMPEEVCRARAEELCNEHNKACPRWVLAHRLASELLVSRQAARYRLKALEIGDDD